MLYDHGIPTLGEKKNDIRLIKRNIFVRNELKFGGKRDFRVCIF